MRRSLGQGGDPVYLVRRARRERPVRVVVMLDVSGSMQPYARYLLQFVRGLVATWREADAYLFNTGLMKNVGVMTPADACDFARYCSALDFWSINDHAEGLTPRVWRDTVDAIRQCNARAGEPANPDMVSFVGWEWSNGAKDDVPSHYGHKSVIFRTSESGMTPTRPIASRDAYPLSKVPAVLLGLLSLLFGVYVRFERRGIGSAPCVRPFTAGATATTASADF